MNNQSTILINKELLIRNHQRTCDLCIANKLNDNDNCLFDETYRDYMSREFGFCFCDTECQLCKSYDSCNHKK